MPDVCNTCEILCTSSNGLKINNSHVQDQQGLLCVWHIWPAETENTFQMIFEVDSLLMTSKMQILCD